MAAPAGRTLFKKKDGILTLTTDYQTVIWTPNTGGPPTISLPVSNIMSKAASFVILDSPSLTLTSFSRSSADARDCCQGYAQDIREVGQWR